MLDSVVREGIIKQIFYDSPPKTNEYIAGLSNPTAELTHHQCFWVIAEL
jgi:hypothetical protein